MIFSRLKTLLSGSLLALTINCSTPAQNIELSDDVGSPSSIKVVDPDFQRSVLELAEKENVCPDEGFKLLHGTWDFRGETRLKSFRNRLVFRDNQFTEFLTAGEGEKQEQAIISGHYACVDGGRLVFHVKTVEPIDGAFGNHADSNYVCTLLWNTQKLGKALALICHVDWDPAKTIDFVYMRSGL